MRTFTAFFILLLFITYPIGLPAKDYVIYSINQSLPMGEPNEIIKKNYYVDLGEKQGVEKGTMLDVFRTISKRDAFKNKERYNYQVKIGELEVLHSEESIAIGKQTKILLDDKAPLFEIEDFIIGDAVKVHVK